MLIIVIGGIAWWASPPAASAEAFASALKGPSGASATPSADLLCLANLPYDRPQINVQQYDLSTRKWMDALASAGLYAPGQPVEGLFQQLIQYTPTEELDKWRQGARLCLAKSWSVSEIKGGTFNPEKRSQHVLYRALVVWKAEGVAPWLAHVPVTQWSADVRLDGGSLTTESSQVFEVRDRRWVVLTPADFGQIQRDVLQPGRGGVNSNAAKTDQPGRDGVSSNAAKTDQPGRGGVSSDAAKTDQGSVFAPLTNIFSGLGAAHPLVGDWEFDQSSAEALRASAFVQLIAGPLPGGRITFGNDYMQAGTERFKARFEVKGNVVSVRREGESDAIPFRIEGKNKMFMLTPLIEIPFNRVQ